MAEFFHGVRTRQAATSLSAPAVVSSGIPFVVGTAPVHRTGGSVNRPVLVNKYEEAAAGLGYSDNWTRYTLCEFMYSQFALFGMAPAVLVNVLDPAVHKKAIDAAEYPLVSGMVTLPPDAIADSVKVANGSGGYYARGVDYELTYTDAGLVLELLDGGTIAGATLNISYDTVDPSLVTKDDIIGGFDVVNKTKAGLELIDEVFPRFSIVPDLVLAPGWSHFPDVAAVMDAKAAKINGLFEAKALIDADCETVRHYSDVPGWKKNSGVNTKTSIVFWPMVSLAGRMFHLSTQAAGLMAQVDRDNDGCPCESPSNKPLYADSAVLADAKEITLDLMDANSLNAAGIVTTLNFIGGFRLWGNNTACFPDHTDVKDNQISVSRTFAWQARTLIMTYWSRVDTKMTRRVIDSVVDTVNIWLAGLEGEGKILGGRVEFREDENPVTDLLNAVLKFHIMNAPPLPVGELEFILEFDPAYLQF